MDWKTAVPEEVSTKDNADILAFAKGLEVGQGKTGLDKTLAGQLARAIELAHGPRTATIKRTGDVYRVCRVEQRQLKARKPRVVAKRAKKAAPAA